MYIGKAREEAFSFTFYAGEYFNANKQDLYFKLREIRNSEITKINKLQDSKSDSSVAEATMKIMYDCIVEHNLYSDEENTILATPKEIFEFFDENPVIASDMFEEYRKESPFLSKAQMQSEQLPGESSED